MLNVPNSLTLLRIVSIPVFLIFLTDGRIGLALVVFVLGGITDSLDGAIARLTNTKTTLGAYLDPLADKMLIVSTFVAFAFMDVVPRWLTVVVVSRDIVIVSGYLILFLLTQELMAIRPTIASKTATFLQLSTLTAVLVDLWSPNLFPSIGVTILIALTGAITAFSGLDYIYRGLVWYQSRVTTT